MKEIHGVVYGKMSEREEELLRYLGNCLADWLEIYRTERRELMCVLSIIMSTIFSKDTPIKDIEDQCSEIDNFCEYLKLRATQ